ncbi:hypothetical protein BU15DRAFT_84241 [Melanogaster broomeanus]|nr:hypothetical protein BU15DRAFT_84241 [Melanogaster broomeanus]
MSNPLVMSAWAPGLIGLAFAGSLYGVALGQSIYYARHFPNDSRLIKFMVLAILWVVPLCMSSANDVFF